MADTKVYLSGGRIQGASTDATGAVDTLGTAVNGTNSGCVTSSDTPFYGNTSVAFDNNDAAHDFGTTSSWANLIKEDFTVIFWAKAAAVGNGGSGSDNGWGSGTTSNVYAGNQGTILNCGQVSGSGNGFVISFDDEGTEEFFVCMANGSSVILNDVIASTNAADTDNNWHLYMFHFDNTNSQLKIYRDGNSTAVQTTSYASQVTTTASTTNTKLFMGRQGDQDGRYLIGSLADVSIWKRLLTTAEFTQLWGTFEDNTSTATNSVKGVRVDALTNQAGLLAHWKLDDLNFTNSAVATDKSKATITDVPVGTRYEETDTRKIYRMATVPNVIIDFGAGGEATASNWTHPSTDSGGNSGAHGFSVTTESSLTGSAGTIDITGRDWDSTIDMVTHCGLATALPAQTKFVIDWDFYRHSDDTSDHPVFAFSSESHGVDPRGGNSSKEVVWACEQNNQDDSPYDGQNSVKLYCKNSSGTSYGNTITVSGDSTSLQTKGETRYWRCIYGEDASTYLSVRLQRYDTAANRTAGGATGRELNLVSGGWASSAAQTAWEAGDPIRYFTLLTYNNGQKAFSIDNITWYDNSLTAVGNVPSWVEKGTA